MHFLRTMIKYSMEIDGMNVLSIFIISFEFVAFIISLIILSILCLQKNKNQKDKDILWIVFLGARYFNTFKTQKPSKTA